MRRLWEKMTDYLVEEDYKGLFRFFIALLPVIIIIIAFLAGLIYFIGVHIEIFAIIGVAILALIGFITTSPKKEPVKPVPDSGVNNIMFFDRILTRGLYDIFKEFAFQFHVIAPNKFIDLKDDLPSCFDSVKGCNIYRFKIIGDGTEIEAELFRELLISKIESALTSQRLSLGKIVVEYQGRLYPRVYLDEIRYVSGAWHLVLIICDTQTTANYIDSQSQNKAFQNQSAILDIEDMDYE